MSTEENTVLQVKQLSKKIGKHLIVSDLSLEVFAGEIFGFLGPNGAGKTTTIRMLVGLIKPTTGSIKISGYALDSHFLEAISQVGCIVENPELYPYLTGRENLQLFARMMDGVDDQRIQEIIELVRMDKRVDDKVSTYSLGMRQRLGIAQALLGKPKLLILDEPTNGLDPAGIRELRSFIRRLSHEEGISVFISSHILHEVQLLCDRVAIIHGGTILQTNRIEELVTDEAKVEWHCSPLSIAADVLKQFPFTSQMDLDEDNEKLWVHMPTDQIAEINRALLEKQVAVMGIRPHQQTLETIFLQLTRGDTVVESSL